MYDTKKGERILKSEPGEDKGIKDNKEIIEALSKLLDAMTREWDFEDYKNKYVVSESSSAFM